MSSSKAVLYGMGNPLLDMTALVDEAYLKKYQLDPNNAILAEDLHRSIYEELPKREDIVYSPGGATQNTIRVAQHFLTKANSSLSASFVGSIGSDEFATTLQKCMDKEKIKTSYMIDESKATGVCAVLVTGSNRSLVTRLDAANSFKESHLESCGKAWDLVEEATFYYIAGYFLTVSTDSMLKVAQYAAKENKCFAMNLSAPFLCQFFKDNMEKVLPYCDIIFGNEDEAVEFAKNFGLKTEDVGEISRQLGEMADKVNSKRKRIVVFTQGADPTVVYHEGQITTYNVLPITSDEIVDTNGAGDAFVGGFLSEYVRGSTMKECVDMGLTAARQIIKVPGCTLPSIE